MKKAKEITINKVTFYEGQSVSYPYYKNVEYEIADGLLKIKTDKEDIYYVLNNLRSFEIKE